MTGIVERGQFSDHCRMLYVRDVFDKFPTEKEIPIVVATDILPISVMSGIPAPYSETMAPKMYLLSP